MKSLIYLPLLLAFCVCVAQAGDVTYKAFKLRTDYGNFVVLSASNSTKCDDLRLVFNTNGDVKKAAKTQGQTVLQASDVETALVTSLSLADFQSSTTFNIQSVAESTTSCSKSRRHRLHSKKNQAKILDSDSVYITTFVNKHSTLKDKLYNSDDEGNNQYFDTASSVKEYWWHGKDKGTGKPTADSVAKDLGLKSGKAAIKAVKLYYRLSGAISKSVILEGNKRFHGENLYKQVPTVSEAAYWFVWKPSGVKDPADIHHEFLEVCLEDGSRLIVDRGSRETALQDTFNTRVRFIFLDSNGGDCSLEGNNWVDKELSDKKFTEKNFNVRAGKQVSGYNLAGLIDHAANYVEKFPKYNTLTNCQHFATNTFNLLTGSTLDYDSIDLMENHSEHSGKEPKLPFGLKIEKASKRRRLQRKSSHKRIHRRRV